MKKITYILLILIGFNTSYSQKKDSLDFSKRNLLMEQMGEVDSLSLKKLSEEFKKSVGEPFTTVFYKIFLSADIKKTYKLSERKNLCIGISNWGCKDFYVPKWLTRAFRENDELYFEILKKNKEGDFVIYKAKGQSHMQEYDIDRKIIALKNRQSHIFENINFDLINPIREIGTYRINIYIDLSDFGYFKMLKRTTESFEVVK